jgi:hypothetical protein
MSSNLTIANFPAVDLGDLHFIKLNVLCTKKHSEDFFRIYLQTKNKNCYSDNGLPRCVYIDSNNMTVLDTHGFECLVVAKNANIERIYLTNNDRSKTLSLTHFILKLTPNQKTWYRNENPWDVRKNNILLTNPAHAALHLHKSPRDMRNITLVQINNVPHYKVVFKRVSNPGSAVFSITEHGKEAALKLAKKWRNDFENNKTTTTAKEVTEEACN